MEFGKELVTSTRSARLLSDISAHHGFSGYFCFRVFQGSLKNSSVYVFVACKMELTWSQASSSCPYCISPDVLVFHVFTLSTARLWAYGRICWSWQNASHEPAAPCLFTRLPTHEDSLCNMSLGQVWKYLQVLKSVVWSTACPIPLPFPQPYVKSRGLQSKAFT